MPGRRDSSRPATPISNSWGRPMQTLFRVGAGSGARYELAARVGLIPARAVDGRKELSGRMLPGVLPPQICQGWEPHGHSSSSAHRRTIRVQRAIPPGWRRCARGFVGERSLRVSRGTKRSTRSPSCGIGQESLFWRQGRWRTKVWCTSVVDVGGRQLIDTVPGRAADRAATPFSATELQGEVPLFRDPVGVCLGVSARF